jgi:hypothetical protein
VLVPKKAKDKKTKRKSAATKPVGRPRKTKRGSQRRTSREQLLKVFAKKLERYNALYQQLDEQLRDVQKVMKADRSVLKALSEL